ncbi:MAG: hypothetical protein WD904_02620 [Dehalococcoidia bacterium]
MAARVLATAGAALLTAGFFAPWVAGTAEFGARDFSGFDLARLVRNFEVVSTSSRESGGLRATAVLLYLVPALAVNSVVVTWLRMPPRIASLLIVTAAAYAATVLFAMVLLAGVSWTELERELGHPLIGIWLSACGAATLAVAGVLLSRRSGLQG